MTQKVGENTLKMQKGERDSIYELFTLEFLRNVVKQIPLVYRRDLAAVSKDFYNVVVEMDELKYVMKLSSELLKDPSIFASIVNSGRVFDKLEVRMESFDKQDMKKLIEVVEEHGSTIKRLELNFNSKLEIDADDLSTFLQKLPNLNEWAVFADYRHCSVIGTPKPVLKNMKSFYFNAYREFVMVMSEQLFEKLSSFIASDTIESLRLHHIDHIDHIINYEKFILRQRNLKSIDSMYYQDMKRYLNAFKNLKLEKIKCCQKFSDDADDANNVVLQLIQEHESLQKIVYGYLPMNATVVETICHRSHHLKSWLLRLTNDIAVNLLQIYKLKELQELSIMIDENFSRADLFTQLTELEMTSIKKFIIMDSTNAVIDFNQITENLGNHWKNIEEFKVFNASISITSILKNLRNLKSLSFRCVCNPVLEYYDGCSWPSLERLEISKHYTHPYLILSTHLMEALPNLSYIHVNSCLYEGASQINALKGMSKLKKLKMSFIVNSSETVPTLDDVQAIRKLCRSTKEFNITFATPLDSKFTQEFAKLLEHESDFMKQTQERGYNEMTLKLKNFKY